MGRGKSKSKSKRSRQEANRANAQHSTGPKTEAGKAVSSRNAFRHGLFSQQTVIPGEDPRAFERMQERYRRAVSPRTDEEELLAERLAVTAWRRERFENAATVVFAAMLTGSDGTDALDDEREPAPDRYANFDAESALAGWAAGYGFEKALTLIDRLRNSEERAHKAAQAELRRAQRERERATRLAAEAEASLRKLDGTDEGLTVKQMTSVLLANALLAGATDDADESLGSFSRPDPWAAESDVTSGSAVSPTAASGAGMPDLTASDVA